MYAYYLLSSVVFAYVVFSTFSLFYKKWYYPIIHPFTIGCFSVAFAYRYASPIPSLAVPQDRMIALGFILAALAFWVGYFLLRTKYVTNFIAFSFAHQADDEKGISFKKLYVYSVVILVVVCGHYLLQYARYGNFEYCFLSAYNFQAKQHLARTTFPLWMRFLNLVFTGMLYWTPYLSLLLLFETLRRHGKQYYFFHSLLAFIILLISATAVFLLGFRSQCFYVCIGTVLLALFAVFSPTRGLKKVSAIFIIFIVFYASLFFLTLPQMRGHKQAIYQLLPTMRSVIMSHSLRIQVLLDNMLLSERTQKKHAYDNLPTLRHMPEAETSGSSASRVETSGSSASQRDGLEKASSFLHESKIVLLPFDLNISYIDRPLTEEEENQRKYERAYLKSYPRFAHNLGPEISWIVLMFGRHTPYLGFSYEFRSIMNTFLPPPLGSGNNFETTNRIIGKNKRGNAPGHFAVGYASYGLIGACCYWMLAAFISGLFAKFIVVYFHLEARYLESSLLAFVLFLVFRSYFVSGYVTLKMYISAGVILWLIVAILYRILAKYRPTGVDAKETETHSIS